MPNINASPTTNREVLTQNLLLKKADCHMTGLIKSPGRLKGMVRGILSQSASSKATEAFRKMLQVAKPNVFWAVGNEAGDYASLARSNWSPCQTVCFETPPDYYCLDRLLVQGHTAPEMMRISTNGTEKRVIDGARKLLEVHAPVLMIQTDQADLIQALEIMGYRSCSLEPDTDTRFFVSVYF